jgi:hypothetical protein
VEKTKILRIDLPPEKNHLNGTLHYGLLIEAGLQFCLRPTEAITAYEK